MRKLGWIVTTSLLLASPLLAELPPADKLPSQSELPDPLIGFDGKRITSADDWNSRRRPELKELFQHYMYGHLPAPEKVAAKLERTDKHALSGKATLKEIELVVGGNEASPIHLMLIVPNERKGPAPVFVGMNFAGNHALLKDPHIHLPKMWIYPQYPGVVKNRATDAGRGAQFDVWALDQSIARGYAVAVFYSGDVDPDRNDERGGMQPFLRKKAAEQGKPADWGTIALWSWGIQRVVDYLVTDKEIDAKRIAVVGHSRLGKTALLTAALDERIALAIPHQAGCGGTAPSRGKVGETVKQINTNFPHWFCANFKQFNDAPDRIPFDQNGLVALVAPRPVLFSNAMDDLHANPEGQFHVLQAADSVYRLLGVEGLGAKERPPVGKLLDSRLGYYIRPGKHSMTREDWKIFLDFADKNLPKN